MKLALLPEGKETKRQLKQTEDNGGGYLRG